MAQTDIDKALAATEKAAVSMREWALNGTQAVSDAVSTQGARNLAAREGGGKYSLSVSQARVIAEQTATGWQSILETPWLGMEFGGTARWYFGFKAGTGWSTWKPMWAPTLRGTDRTEKGYIMGAAWSELNRSGDPTNAMVNATLEGWRKAFKDEGLVTRTIL